MVHTFAQCHNQHLNAQCIQRDSTERFRTLRLCELSQYSTRMAHSHELKAYAKVTSDIYKLNHILFLNHKIILSRALRSEMLLRIHEGHLAWTNVKPWLGQLCIGSECHRISRTWWHDMGCATHINKSNNKSLPYPVLYRPWQTVEAHIFTLNGKG